jgi:hypothetical protein
LLALQACSLLQNPTIREINYGMKTQNHHHFHPLFNPQKEKTHKAGSTQ